MVKTAICENCGRAFRPKFKRGAYTRNCSPACGYATRSRERRTDWRERFWAKVDKRKESECWPWTAATTGFGYGVFSMTGSHDLHGAHRVSWFVRHGRWPTDCLLHRCDTPACVNPDHLFEGSRTENMTDKINKGRQPKGTATGRAKLTEEQALAVLNDTRPQHETAAAVGVDQSTVSDIKTGRSWAHLPRH